MNIIKLKEVDNTNEELKRRAAQGAENLTAIIAEKQTAGRGRYGRVWESEAGNLYCSILLRDVDIKTAHQLVHVAALAVVETVESYLFDSKITLKWPNDVLVDGKKIAGILLESSGTADKLDYVIIGVGINVESCPDYATSFKKHNSEQNLEDIEELFLDVFEEYLEVWKTPAPEGGFERIGNLWMQNAAFLDEQITVKLAEENIEGIFKGLTDNGEMVLEKGGKEEIISYGEIYASGN
ncbi:MAG: biotin--[acetyl-CoA-carboxylase] ligase [Alphaproteobacteria bacterium CG11_big_fil_rev_8_21_14_0_20_44_7]|nr:MAG: biotin--[acetyl-CoA-carboxylase] ligase [Alphaproteobacteria bacterium CG11_big_fil_rev_8_21_14_0_20_44_7]